MALQDYMQRMAAQAVAWALAGINKDEYENEYRLRLSELERYADYYEGRAKKPIVSRMGKDYNVLANLTGLIIDRSVAGLFGAGVQFDLPGEDDTEQAQYIDAVWSVSHKQKFITDLGQFGATFGTTYIKIVPDALTDRLGRVLPRLVNLNPSQMTIGTDPHDVERVVWYMVRYNVGDTGWREITERDENDTWTVRTEKTDKGGKWSVIDEYAWPWPFPPIAHEKNLPKAGSVYGQSDIEDVIGLQDDYNESRSNTKKILSYFAFPQRYVAGGRLPRRVVNGQEVIDFEPGKVFEFDDPQARIGAMEMQSDMASSRAFTDGIRLDMFDVARTSDVNTVRDKIGALTNFGLRVLFKDELAKLKTKQLLYGELFKTVNERLLLMAGYAGEAADPGEVVFGDSLPTNETEQIAALKEDLAMGIVSKQTAAARRGYDWEAEQERIAGEQAAQGATSANVGGAILRNFLSGR
jgi:hypothetical protein